MPRTRRTNNDLRLQHLVSNSQPSLRPVGSSVSAPLSTPCDSTSHPSPVTESTASCGRGFSQSYPPSSRLSRISVSPLDPFPSTLALRYLFLEAPSLSVVASLALLAIIRRPRATPLVTLVFDSTPSQHQLSSTPCSSAAAITLGARPPQAVHPPTPFWSPNLRRARVASLRRASLGSRLRCPILGPVLGGIRRVAAALQAFPVPASCGSSVSLISLPRLTFA